MKAASKSRSLPFSRRAKQKSSAGPAIFAFQSSTKEINERGRAAIEEAKMAVEDARIAIADSIALVAELRGRRRAANVSTM